MESKDTLTVGELAGIVGVPVSTIRYYERRGLIEPEARSQGNYRLYSTASVGRLRFIRAAQEAGFTLKDIAALLDFRDGVGAPCHPVQELIRKRLRQIEQQTERLRSAKALLNNWLDVCRETQRSGRCAVIEGLAVDTDNPAPTDDDGQATETPQNKT